jgi:uncharacterized protein (TIGR03066 family)
LILWIRDLIVQEIEDRPLPPAIFPRVEDSMIALRLLAIGLFVLPMSGSAGAEDKKERPDYARLIIGKWEVTKSDRPTGAQLRTTIEFKKNGTVIITENVKGRVESYGGIYQIAGDRLQLTLKLPDMDEEKDPVTISKLTDKELHVKSQRGDKVELKRPK